MNWKKSPFETLAQRQASIPGALYEIEGYSGKRAEELPLITNLTEMAMAIAERLVNRKFVIVGDYDCDGIMSTVIVYLALSYLASVAEKLSGKKASTVEIVVPDRVLDGYGFSVSHAEKIRDSVVLLLDNGIVQYAAIEKAKENGNDVFVVDHHMPGETLPAADIIVNPHAIAGGDFDNYCAAGLCYRLVKSLYAQNWLVKNVPGDALAQQLKEYLFLAAVATVADVVPVLWENRVIVKEGMKYIPPRWDNICYTLLDSKKNSLNEGDIAFKIAPAINAMGRLGELDADFVKALATDMDTEPLASRMQYMNALRKQKTKDIMKAIQYDRSKKVIVVPSSQNVPSGIAGIIAGNISERYGKPAFVFGESENGLVTGSARAVKGTLHLKNLLDTVEKELPGITVRYGGHESAAGVTIKESDQVEFANALNDLAEYSPVKEREYDFDLDADGYDWFSVYDAIQEYAPYGEGNPSPMLHMHIYPKKENVVIMAKDHLKIKNGMYEAVGFNMANRVNLDVLEFDLYGSLQLNEYRGGTNVQMNIEDFCQPDKPKAEEKPLTDFAKDLFKKMSQ